MRRGEGARRREGKESIQNEYACHAQENFLEVNRQLRKILLHQLPASRFRIERDCSFLDLFL